MLEKFLLRLVTLNLRDQDKECLKRCLTKSEFIKEHRTVSLGTSRGSGHTAAGINLAKYFKIVYLTMNDNMANNILLRDDYKTNTNNILAIGSITSLKSSIAVRDETAQVIVIDYASHVKPEDIQAVRETMSIDSCLVLLE